MDETTETAVERWSLKADHNTTAANALLRDNLPSGDVACFYAQHCIEKAVDALEQAYIAMDFVKEKIATRRDERYDPQHLQTAFRHRMC